ncbi:MAG: glycosyltransferase family 4 protein [Bacteroidota bacterium]
MGSAPGDGIRARGERPLKIALATDRVDSVSGLGRIVQALSRTLAGRNSEVWVLARSVSGVSEGVRTRTLPEVPFSRALGKLSMRHTLARAVAGRGFDILHSFGVGRGADVVSAQSCHREGMEVRRRVGHRVLPHRGWGLFDRVVLGDERALYGSRRTRRIVAVSGRVREELIRWYGVDPERIVVIPNGYHPPAFSPRAGDAPEEGSSVVLLFVGNEFDRKGLGVLLEAAALLRSHPVTILVAGSDDPRPWGRLAERLGIGARVRFLGVPERIEPLYARADVFVFPTLYEPFGMVVVEAMAAGLPVIASAGCGAVEGFRRGKDLLLVDDPLCAAELARALRSLVDDPGLRRSLGEAARLAVRHMSWDSVAERLAGVYGEVMAEKTS